MMTRRAGMDALEEDKYSTINFEETELRLGLPRATAGSSSSPNDATDLHTTLLKNNICTSTTGKRGFSVDLKLNLSSNNSHLATSDSELKNTTSTSTHIPVNESAKPPAAKAQVVGWPPVRSSRKNIVSLQKNNSDEAEKANPSTSANTNRDVAAFVKVSMDGAPYLRKVDLKLYKSYEQLSDVLSKMFGSFTIGKKEFMNESKLIDLLNGSDYVPTYEDKEGDWMLMGDVPWEMFVESCKRLRIMKGSEVCNWASTKTGGEVQEPKKLNGNFDIPTTECSRQRARLGIGVPRKQTGSTKMDPMIGV